MADKYWFKHDYNARNDEKLLELRAEHGPAGYGIFWMLIEKMAEHNQGWLDGRLKGGITIDLGIDKNAIQTIINYCLEVELFHKNSDGFIFNNRMNEHKNMRNSLSEAGKRGVEKREQNRQSKPGLSHPSSDKIREEEIRREEKRFIPPSLIEVKEYFLEKGYSELAAEKAFNFYDSSNWHDSKGNQVKSWKQKMISVWFVPENIKPAIVMAISPTVIDHRKNADSWR